MGTASLVLYNPEHMPGSQPGQHDSASPGRPEDPVGAMRAVTTGARAQTLPRTWVWPLCCPRRTIVISEMLFVCFSFSFSFPMSSRHPSSWPVRNSDRGLQLSGPAPLRPLETAALIPTKPVFLQKEREPGICFICNVTLADVLRCNHMFVKLFVPCKLMNQTILGFPSAFASEKCICQHPRSRLFL